MAVCAEAVGATIRVAPCDGPATLETDPAARVLLLWGRRTADPSRVCSKSSAATLGRLRSLLSGYELYSPPLARDNTEAGPSWPGFCVCCGCSP